MNRHIPKAVVLCMLVLLALSRTAPAGQAGKSPVKVFILAGQSNMEGQGVVDLEGKDYNQGKGTLNYVMKDPAKAPLFRHLKNDKGEWVVRDNVWVWFKSASGLKTGGLTIGFSGYGGKHHIGPEFQFGHVIGDRLANQVLLIKTAWGGKSLYKDFRPPSSGGTVGPYYTKMLQEVREALADIKKYFPDYDGGGYELAGFVWYHGWNDGCEPKTAVPEYEANLVNLIKDMRREFKAPNLPVAIGELTGPWVQAPGEWATLRRAQAAAAARPEFRGTVAFAETHDFVRKPEESPNPGHGHHEFGNAVQFAFNATANPPTWQKISVPSSPSLQLGGGDFTLEAWVKPDTAALNGRMTILSKDGSYALSLYDGFPKLLLNFTSNGNVGALVPLPLSLAGNIRVAADGTWSHVAAVREGLEARLYLNGVPCGIAGLPSDANVVVANANALTLAATGASDFLHAEPYSGYLDEVRISAVARYTGGITPDLSGHSHDGAVLGGATIDPNGRIGGCIALNGTTQKVQVVNSTDFQFGGNGFTLEAYVYPSGTSGNIISMWDSGQESYRLSLVGGHLQLDLSTDGSTTALTLTGTSPISTTAWTKVSAVRSGNTITLYVNDAADATNTNNPFNGALFNGTSLVLLGDGFAGKLDNVRILPGALSVMSSTTTNTVYEYNARNQLVTETAVTGTTTVVRDYSYDPNGNNSTFASAASPLSNVGFETPGLGNGNYAYNPAGASWTFTGQSGISGNGSTLTAGNPNAPEGAQVAFVQGTGSFSQTATFAAGTYTLAFMAAQMVNNQTTYQTFQVFVDTQSLGTCQPLNGRYAKYATGTFTLTAGAHTISFVGLNPNGGNNVAFIDRVEVDDSHAIIETTNGTVSKITDMYYDSLNRMTSWTDGTTTATYAHRGIESVRSSKTVTTGGTTTTTSFLMEGQREIAEFINGSMTRSYVYGTYIDEQLGMYRPGQSPLYYTRNGLYNVAALADSTGAAVERYKYQAFGKATVLDASGNVLPGGTAVGNPWTFTGRRLDGESRLMYYRARMCQTDLGRFLARDPYYSYNLYEYVGSAPATSADPYGLFKDMHACCSIEKKSVTIYDPTDPGFNSYGEAINHAGGEAYPANNVTGPGSIAQAAGQAAEGWCQCLETITIASHRGADPGGVGAVSGDLTFGGHSTSQPVTFTPNGAPGDLHAPPPPPGSSGPMQPPQVFSLASLGRELGKLTCQPCFIDITACGFAANIDALRELATASGCTVTGSEGPVDLSVHGGVPGYGIESGGPIISFNPDTNTTTTTDPDAPYGCFPHTSGAGGGFNNPADPTTTPLHHWPEVLHR